MSPCPFVLLIYIGGCSSDIMPPHIFSIQVKSGACYITGQWGRVHNKIKET